MPELDHLIVASPDLDEGIAYVESLTGARAEAGGPHPGVGTHNALLTFDETTYFEIIAVDPSQPDPARARPFGLDEGRPPHLAGYAIHPEPGETIEEVAELMRSLGFDPGMIADMSRVQPSGEEISWRLTYGGEPTPPAAGVLPFVIDWGSSPSPATTLRSMGTLRSLRITHPEAEVRAAATALDVGLDVADGAPSLVAVVATPNGDVKLS